MSMNDLASTFSISTGLDRNEFCLVITGFRPIRALGRLLT
jgi:hypothetical protein